MLKLKRKGGRGYIIRRRRATYYALSTILRKGQLKLRDFKYIVHIHPAG